MDGPLIDPAIAMRLPRQPFLMTACLDDTRTGLVTPWVQQCSAEPILLSIALPRGTSLEPLIRDSRRFALTALDPEDRIIPRRFDPPPPADEDPFFGLRILHSVTGCPILRRGLYWFDCELVGHLAPEATHRVYLGQVMASGLCDDLSMAEKRRIAASKN